MMVPRLRGTNFLKKIKNGSLLSSIPFSGFRAIINQHLRSIYDSLIDNNGKNNKGKNNKGKNNLLR